MSRLRKFRSLPILLLCAAWACANCPSFVTVATLTWLAEARSFSHQQRLSLEVASLLTGQKTPGLIAKARETHKSMPKPALPPTTSSTKKVELALESSMDLPALTPRGEFRRLKDFGMPEAARRAPPHEPPRGGMLV